MLNLVFGTAENELSEVDILTIFGDFDGLVMNKVSDEMDDNDESKVSAVPAKKRKRKRNKEKS